MNKTDDDNRNIVQAFGGTSLYSELKNICCVWNEDLADINVVCSHDGIELLIIYQRILSDLVSTSRCHPWNSSESESIFIASLLL